MAEAPLDAALGVIRRAALRAGLAGRLQPEAEQRLLQSIVDATVRLFDAEAASLALFESDPDRLEFRVVAGPSGAGASGMSVKPTQGIVGYVYSTGEALAVSDVASDPRWDRSAAERTGYLPRSIAAVPLVDEEGTHGVLQVLDKRGSPTFTLRDMELLGVFAAQAATAIAVTRVQRDLPTLLRGALRQLAGMPGDLAEEDLDALVSAATADLDHSVDAPFWRLTDQVSRLRNLGEREQRLVADILAVVVRHGEERRGRRR